MFLHCFVLEPHGFQIVKKQNAENFSSGESFKPVFETELTKAACRFAWKNLYNREKRHSTHENL